jgi:hypothetical protein
MNLFLKFKFIIIEKIKKKQKKVKKNNLKKIAKRNN